MKIDPETFEEWLAHPITEALVRVCERGIKDAAATWAAESLDGGICDPMRLSEIRTRIAVLREVKALKIEDFEE